MNAKITSFATYQDLVGYIKCLLGGGTEDACYNHGDNGVGASGKTTGQQHAPMVAVPSVEMKKKWGSTSAAWGKKIKVSIPSLGFSAIGECADIAPTGVCDLNPAMLIAIGLRPDVELSIDGHWEWAE